MRAACSLSKATSAPSAASTMAWAALAHRSCAPTKGLERVEIAAGLRQGAIATRGAGSGKIGGGLKLPMRERQR